MFWLICLCFSAFCTIGGVIYCISEGKLEIMLGVAVFAIFDIIFYKKYHDKKTGKTAEKKQAKRESKEAAEKTIYGKHQAGLPLAQDAPCTIIAENDCFKFIGGGNSFELNRSKITDISVKTDVEIQKQYVSSAGGAIAGGMVFGPLGAIVGGRVKEKKTREFTYYLIFTYRSDAEISYISFEIWSSMGVIKKIEEWRKELLGNVQQADAIQL